MFGSRRAFIAEAAVTLLGSAHLPARASPPTAMSIGVLPPSDLAAEPYYALAENFFIKAGLAATVEPFANGPALITAVVAKHLDVAYSNVLSLAVARERGIEMLVLAPANLHVHAAPTAGILAVKRTSPIVRAKDLAGRTIAVEGINSIAAISTRAWIDANGGDSKAVNFVEITLSASVPAILAGRVDAAALDAIHYTTTAESADALRALCSSTLDAIAPNFAPSVWFATPDWVAAHPDAARAFVRVMRDTAVWANAHHPESARILAPYTGQTPAEIQKVVRVTYGTALTPALIQPAIDVAAKYGLIKAGFPASAMIAKP